MAVVAKAGPTMGAMAAPPAITAEVPAAVRSACGIFSAANSVKEGSSKFVNFCKICSSVGGLPFIKKSGYSPFSIPSKLFGIAELVL